MAGVVLLSQIAFIYLRTLNVIYTSDRSMWPSVVTGVGIGITWMIGIAIGVNALNEMMWQPILAHLIGGVLGTIWAFRHKSAK